MALYSDNSRAGDGSAIVAIALVHGQLPSLPSALAVSSVIVHQVFAVVHRNRSRLDEVHRNATCCVVPMFWSFANDGQLQDLELPTPSSVTSTALARTSHSGRSSSLASSARASWSDCASGL